MSKRRLCIQGGCGSIGRSLVARAISGGEDVAVMDLRAALEYHPTPSSALAIEIDRSDQASGVRAFGQIASR